MDLVYSIRRSEKRRKLTITVERDRSVVVHAPTAMSDETIRTIVESKRQWLYEKIGHPRKYQELPHPPGKELVNGESALYLGRQYRIEVVKTGLSEVQFAQRFLIPAAALPHRFCYRTGIVASKVMLPTCAVASIQCYQHFGGTHDAQHHQQTDQIRTP